MTKDNLLTALALYFVHEVFFCVERSYQKFAFRATQICLAESPSITRTGASNRTICGSVSHAAN